MAAYIPQALREAVRQRARQQCEYCRSVEWMTGQRFELDHIPPLQLGGTTSSENLCLACSECNSHKQARVEGFDAESGVIAPSTIPVSIIGQNISSGVKTPPGLLESPRLAERQSRHCK